MSRKYKNVCTTLIYIEHFLILSSTTARCIDISVFGSLLLLTPIGIASYIVQLKICAIAAGIKKYKKKKKEHEKTVLLAKYKLNSIKDLISKALINSIISHDEFALTNNVLKEHYEQINMLDVIKKS